MTNTGRWLCFSVLGLLLLAAASHPAGASSLPAGFADTAVHRPDGRSWDNVAGVAFAGDGRMFVWERTGRVWLLAGTATRSEPLIDLSDEVSTIGSLGLTGLALDPRFARNGYLYLFYAVDPQHLANCDAPAHGDAACRVPYRAGEHASSGATIGRLVRYQLARPAGAQDFRAATTVNYASRQVLLGETPAGADVPTGCVVTDGAHGPGALAFGSDGTLFVGCGDGAGVSAEDSGSDPTTHYQEALAARLMAPAENVGAFRAQLVDSLSGKILRLDAASGDGVPSNPFYDPKAPRAPRSRVWVLGLHDPQHFTVRPGSGSTRVAELSSMEEQVNARQEQLQTTQTRVAVQSLRDLPIQLSFHDAVLRSGKVAVLHNLDDADLEIVLEVESPASGEHVRRPLVINAHGMHEIGAAQGWQFSLGQIVTLNNDKYRPLVRIVS